MTPLSAVSIIRKKRDGLVLENTEIRWFIQGLLTGEVTDYQASALLMAIYLKGMNEEETADLTKAMLESGKTYKLPVNGPVDKHSTGGVGDKASFILAPLAAAVGAPVPMVAGRGLGHTGGTIDKMEGVPGLRTALSEEEFVKTLQSHDVVIMGQTSELAPADKRLYALRDVTGTIESIPLITGSIMSKKLAEGAAHYVFDIKVGEGAFMKDLQTARELAKSLCSTAKRFGKTAVAYLTNMDRPLGMAVGNNIEMHEVEQTLKGEGPKDLEELSLLLAQTMVYLSFEGKLGLQQSRELTRKALSSGEGLNKLQNLFMAQGGEKAFTTNMKELPLAKEQTVLKAPQGAYLHKMGCTAFGNAIVELGGGRKRKEDIIDHEVGLMVHARPGEYYEKGDALLTIYHHDHQKTLAKALVTSLEKEQFIWGPNPKEAGPLILDVIDTEGLRDELMQQWIN